MSKKLRMSLNLDPIEQPTAISDMSITYIEEKDNCSSSDDDNYLTIKAENGSCDDDGYFLVIETKRWAFDNRAELLQLVDDYVKKAGIKFS